MGLKMTDMKSSWATESRSKPLPKERTPIGLPNLGNTCYVNSMLQCMYNSECMRAFVEQDGHQILDLFSVFREEGSRTNYVNLLKRLKVDVVPKEFAITEQNDAHEFGMYLFDFYLERLRNTRERGETHGDLSNTSFDEFLQNSREQWFQRFSPIMPVVYMQTARITKCGCCENTCVNIETNPFVHIDTFEVRTGLDYFFGSKDVPDWRCDKCGKHSPRSTTTMACVRPPKLLIVCLNRFLRKPNSKISIPKSLNMTKYCVEEERLGCRYDLKSTVNHSGSMNFGHYTANIVMDNTHVLKIDDDDIGKPRDLNERDLANVYILFYERVE